MWVCATGGRQWAAGIAKKASAQNSISTSHNQSEEFAYLFEDSCCYENILAMCCVSAYELLGNITWMNDWGYMN